MIFNPIIDSVYILLASVLLLIYTIYIYLQTAESLTIKQRNILLTCRVLALTILMVIFLQPSKSLQEPLVRNEQFVAIGFDQSKSMLQADVEGEQRLDYVKRIWEQVKQPANLNLKYFAFDKQTKPLNEQELQALKAQGTNTKFHDSLSEFLKTQPPFSISAMILFTDGHDFQGISALETAATLQNMHTELYAIPVGSDRETRDLSVLLDASQDYVFQNKSFLLEAVIRAQSCQYEKVSLDLMRGDEVLQTKSIFLENEREVRVHFSITEADLGSHFYQVRVSELDAEADYKNNNSGIYIKCIDDQLSVLLLEGEPHWESTFLRRFLTKNNMIKLDSFTYFKEGSISSTTFEEQTSLPKDIQEFLKYDIIVLGKNINRLLDDSLVKQLSDAVHTKSLNLVFLRGNAFSDDVGKKLEPVVWSASGVSNVSLLPSLEGKRNSLFKQFEVDQATNGGTPLPGLRLVRNVELSKPLSISLGVAVDETSDQSPGIIYRRMGKGQVISIGFSGMWQWRFHSDRKKFPELYQSYWNQLLLWIIHNGEFIPGRDFSFKQDYSRILLGDDNRFQVAVRDQVFGANFNKKIEITTPDNQMHQLFLQQNLEVPYRYEVSFRPEKEGIYSVTWKNPQGKTEELLFSCIENQTEEKEVAVRPAYLKSMTEATGGRLLVTPEEISALLEELSKRNNEGSEMRSHLDPLWDNWFLAYIILFFLGLDWYLRRKWGLC
ncbi:MAG: hypothetical protein MK193_05110 [Lentisphaeria bacterium]|nr:hypothetical protein [Lentisphaeria bacterium]